MKFRWLLILALAGICSAQSWTGFLASSRGIDWTKAGLPATFPDGETTPNPWTPPTRSTICSTVSPSGDTSGATDTTNITNAYNACTNTTGKTLKLAAGQFYINNNLSLYGASYGPNNVVVAGQGACNNTSICTIITGASGTWHWVYMGGGGTGTSGALTATSYAKGATTVTVASNPPTNGSIAVFVQCDTGLSGGGCTGTPADNGGLFVCSNTNCTGGTSTGYTYEQQYVLVTGVSGDTVTFTPGLYAPNWSSNNTATLNWGTFAVGQGIQDINFVNLGVNISGCFACWIKGNRFVENNSNGAVTFLAGTHYLVFNNYVDNTYLANQYNEIFSPSSGEAGISDSLILNNILHNAEQEGGGSTSGVIYAYNYDRDTVSNDNYSGDFQHGSGDFFQLREGNEFGTSKDDNTHGSHFFSLDFRNWITSGDIPFHLTGNPGGLEFADFARFGSSVGNVLGWLPPGGGYYAAGYLNGTLPTLYWIDQFSGDPLTLASSMRWGDYAICSTSLNADCSVSGGTFNSANVPNSTNMPSSTYPNAVTWQNPTPGTHSLPCSVFLQGFAASTTCTPYPSGGTGLSWWKTVTAWATFPTSSSTTTIPPFPPIGPDVSGGSRSDAAGYVNDIPAAIAWSNLPIDTTLQNSYTATGSSWSSSNGGTETLTFNSGTLPACPIGSECHLQGGFQLTTTNSGNQSACMGGLSEQLISTVPGTTGSNPTQITYTLASSPEGGGSNACVGTFKFPDIRQFDERVYQTDSASTYTITVSSIVGNGTVTSSDSVINCTTGTTGTCADSTATGTVTLTESPSSGYSFGGWGGGTCTGTSSTCAVTSAATVTATFNLIPTVDVTIKGVTVTQGVTITH